jgi:hypothetical protein
MGGRRYTAKQVAEAVREARGFITVAAEALGCHRSTVQRYVNEYATVQDALEDAREKRHDFVENKLMAAINDGNVTAMIFYLKTQCKDRGYVERYQQEVTGRDGGPIETKQAMDDDTRDRALSSLAATIAASILGEG